MGNTDSLPQVHCDSIEDGHIMTAGDVSYGAMYFEGGILNDEVVDSTVVYSVSSHRVDSTGVSDHTHNKVVLQDVLVPDDHMQGELIASSSDSIRRCQSQRVVPEYFVGNQTPGTEGSEDYLVIHRQVVQSQQPNYVGCKMRVPSSFDISI